MKLPKTFLSLPLLGLTLVALTAPGCNNNQVQTSAGGGGGAATTFAFGDLLLTAEAADELFTLRIVLAGLVLERDDGTLTAELLGAPLEIELQGLAGGRHRWLAGAGIPSGSYVAARLRFAPGAAGAQLLDGTRAAVLSATDELRVAFPSTLVLAQGDYVRLVLELDAEASVALQADGTVAFDPVVAGAPAGMGDELALEKLDGFVSQRDVATLALGISGFSGSEGEVALGAIDLLLEPLSLLVDERGTAFSSTPLYFTLLSPDVTFLDVDGALDASGAVRTRRLEIDAQDGVPGSRYRVRLEGTVVALTSERTFLLQLREVDRGRVFADPVLAELGDPAQIEISFDERTLFFAGPFLVDPAAALVIGNVLRAKFTDFAGEPLPALRVEVVGSDPRF
jgi:hypothetical protein